MRKLLEIRLRALLPLAGALLMMWVCVAGEIRGTRGRTDVTNMMNNKNTVAIESYFVDVSADAACTDRPVTTPLQTAP